MINGCGIKFYGVKNTVCNQEWEEFDTNKWFCLVWFPIIPLGSYRIKRRMRYDFISKIARNGIWSEQVYIIAGRRFDWRQVVITYAWVYGWFVALFLIIKLFIGR